jgi:hypothetical protein
MYCDYLDEATSELCGRRCFEQKCYRHNPETLDRRRKQMREQHRAAYKPSKRAQKYECLNFERCGNRTNSELKYCASCPERNQITTARSQAKNREKCKEKLRAKKHDLTERLNDYSDVEGAIAKEHIEHAVKVMEVMLNRTVGRPKYPARPCGLSDELLEELLTV